MVHAKKSLGQHFLRSQDALRKIISAGNLGEGDLVLEIGPGEGALTRGLLETGARVIAVETDTRCLPLLRENFSAEIHNGKLVLIEGDIRDKKTQKELFNKKYLGKEKYKLIANIPYYITGMLFKLFLEELRQPSLLVFLIQKEVANQIIGKNGKEGILSLSVKIFGTPRLVARVKKEAFTPPPKVDSTIIAVENISRTRFGTLSIENYFRIIKAGLHAKRKMLLGNLSHALAIKREVLEGVFKTLNIKMTSRGEDLNIDTWIKLAQAIEKKTKR